MRHLAIDDFADPNSLGAPGIFVDDDGSKYLFYTYYSAANGGNNKSSEGQISAVKLISLIVPEPATITLLAIGGLLTLRRRYEFRNSAITRLN